MEVERKVGVYQSRLPLTYAGERSSQELVKELTRIFPKAGKAQVSFQLGQDVNKKGKYCYYLQIISTRKLSYFSFTKIRYYIMGFRNACDTFMVDAE